MIEFKTYNKFLTIPFKVPTKPAIGELRPVSILANNSSFGGTEENFTVVLTGYGDKKIQVIKIIREITRLGLKEAKELVDKFPGNIKEGIVKEEAENIKKKVEEAGGTVELK